LIFVGLLAVFLSIGRREIEDFCGVGTASCCKFAAETAKAAKKRP
jgi:hypothetical protein